MDPNTTWQHIRAALAELYRRWTLGATIADELEDVRTACESLRYWLSNRGFPPAGMTREETARALRTIGRLTHIIAGLS